MHGRMNGKGLKENRKTTPMDEGRKRVLAIVAGILVKRRQRDFRNGDGMKAWKFSEFERLSDADIKNEIEPLFVRL
jgi:hypothetical protein